VTLIETGNGAGKAGVEFRDAKRWSWRVFGKVLVPRTRAWCGCGWSHDFKGDQPAAAGRVVQKHWGQAHR